MYVIGFQEFGAIMYIHNRFLVDGGHYHGYSLCMTTKQDMLDYVRMKAEVRAERRKIVWRTPFEMGQPLFRLLVGRGVKIYLAAKAAKLFGAQNPWTN